MKGKAILLATIMVVSMAVAGIGGASAASATDSVQSTQQAPVQPQENTTNATPQLGGDDGEDDSDLPEPVDVPPNQLKNGTLDPASVPSSFDGAETGGYSVESKDQVSAQSVRGASYNPSPTELAWFGYDGTGQAGNGSAYYVKNYTLRTVAPHVEVWVANDLSFEDGDTTNRTTPSVSDRQATYLASEFESNIYPNESEYFRTPDFRNGENGLVYNRTFDGKTYPDDYFKTGDNSSRTVLLVDNIRDEAYYNSSYPVYTAGLSSPTIDNYADRNVAFIDAANWDNRLGGPNAPWKPENDEDNSNYSIEGTTAHEYQHILHGDADANEESWINEGFSDFAIYITGYGLDRGHINAYLDNPSNSLTTWGDQGQAQILRDYGGAFLFQLYGNEQYGTEFTKAIFNDEANGIQGVKNSLDQVGADRNFYQLYQDFSTMLVTDGLDTSANGRYQLEVADLETNTSHEVAYTRNNTTAAWGNAYNPLGSDSGAVNGLNVSGIDFKPTPWTTTADPTDDSDDQVLYSGSGNGLDNFAIFNADLSDTDSPTLDFDTYYNIERGWDYGFVQVSTDGGDTWNSLSNENTTDYTASPLVDQTVAANLPGFTGISGGNASDNDTSNDDPQWVNEQFDLSNYTDDGNVLIAFRYVTDGAAIQPGFYARDISVSETDIDYDGSSTEPFQSLREAQQNYLRYEFSLLGVGEDGSTEVQHYDPTEFEDGNITSLEPLLDGDYDRTILAASWAPDPEETGTVPYGYSVNAEEEPPAGENTLRIAGDGDRAFYALRASSDVSGMDLTGEDSVSGASAAGAVAGGSDSYTFSGELENLYVGDTARVFLNGERIDPDEYESTLNIEGSGDRSTYDFTVQDGTITDTAGLTGEDSVSGPSASGAVAGGSDEYTVTGSMRGLDVDGDASLVLNGIEVPPRVFYNTIAFEGTGSTNTYEFSVNGEIQSTMGLTGEDSVSDSHASGAVRGGTDTYVYSGIITDLEYSNDADAAVTRNGASFTENDV